MSEFEFSTLGVLAALLAALAAYSYWQVHRAQKAHRIKERSERLDVAVAVANKGFFSKLNERLNEYQRRAAVSEKTIEHDDLPKKTEKKPETKVPTFPLSHPAKISVDAQKLVVPITPEPMLQADDLLSPVATFKEPEPVDELNSTAALLSREGVESNPSSLLLEGVIEEEPSDAQFFTQQDEAEHASLMVFEPLLRLASWMQTARSEPIKNIHGVIDITLSQPKNQADIEHGLYDLRLDTDLPLRIYGRRSGQQVVTWQPLESGALYSGLRLTLQLANISTYADSALIQDWFMLAQRLSKRLASTTQAWPDPAALASYAVYLHDLAQQLAMPLVIQLHKPVGLWAGYEIHQHMTQNGLQLNEQGQYTVRAENGMMLYSVLNDINNPRVQDFLREALPTMHANTLSFCLDLARVPAEHEPSRRLWHDVGLMANALQGTWCNTQGMPLDVAGLMAHADVQITEYYRQLNELNIPAGSMVLRQLLRG